LREALASDDQAITRLYRLLVPGDRDVAVTPERIDQIAADSNNFLFVLEENGRVLGTGFLTLCLDPMYGRLPYAVLENLVVDPNARNRGYGRFLAESIEVFCWQRHCTKIMLLSSAFRSEAHLFFSALGFARDKKVAFVKYRRGKYDAAYRREANA